MGLGTAVIVAGVIVAAAMVWAALRIGGQLQPRADPGDRLAALLALFAPALAATQQDPRAFLVWQPFAKAARQLFPQEFATLDAAIGGGFPFSRERLEAAHSQWTADWLAWELAHDTEYKLKAVVAEHELAVQGSPAARARVESIEREKIELYQRHYADYIRTAKALQALIS